MGWKKAHVKRTLLKMQTRKKNNKTQNSNERNSLWASVEYMHTKSSRSVMCERERDWEKARFSARRNTSDSRVKSNAITYGDGARAKTVQLILLCIARSFGFFFVYCMYLLLARTFATGTFPLSKYFVWLKQRQPRRQHSLPFIYINIQNRWCVRFSSNINGFVSFICDLKQTMKNSGSGPTAIFIWMCVVVYYVPNRRHTQRKQRKIVFIHVLSIHQIQSTDGRRLQNWRASKREKWHTPHSLRTFDSANLNLCTILMRIVNVYTEQSGWKEEREGEMHWLAVLCAVSVQRLEFVVLYHRSIKANEFGTMRAHRMPGYHTIS